MITPSYGPTSGHAPATDRDGRRPRRDADADRDAERFRQLLAPPAPLPEPHRAADDATPPDTPEGLQLRAASGPLAGLMVTAGWHGGRLILRLSAPSGALRDRLAQTGDTLGATLSDLLGIPVTVETAYEPCRPL